MQTKECLRLMGLPDALHDAVQEVSTSDSSPISLYGPTDFSHDLQQLSKEIVWGMWQRLASGFGEQSGRTNQALQGLVNSLVR